MIEAERDAGRTFVMEGAALRPEYIAPLVSDRIFGVLLHADDAFLRQPDACGRRLCAARRCRTRPDRRLHRPVLAGKNAALYGAARETGLRIVDAEDEQAVAGLFD